VSAAAITTPAAAPASALANSATITARNLRRLTRVPTLIAFATVQPILFVLLFTYGFGGAVHPPGVERYIDYLLPGIFILSIGFGASQTGVAVAEDLATGMIDRFRSLPIAGSAVLVGRIAADAIRNLLVIALIIGVGSIIGFRFHAGPAAALAAVVLAVGVGLAFSSTNALLGLVIRDAESAGLAGLFPVIILVFTSSALVPTETMPSWLEAFANVNPITVSVDALRALCLGGPTATAVAKAIAWNATILAITLPLASRRYQRAAAA
jgi:ABC-2 type transport system permease protein/oleandomycin transport system permease protein